MWLENEGCHVTMARAWRIVPSGPPMAQVMEKIENCQVRLRQWSKHSMCNITRTLVNKKKSLQQAEDAAVKGGNVDFFRQVKTEVNDLLRLEEKLWQQQSHTHWIVSSDRNTSYFHNRASQRFRRNNISELQALNGRLVSGDENVSALIVEYYQLLFTSSSPSDIKKVVQHTNRRVDDTMNAELIKGGKIVTPPSLLSREATMDCLIDPHSGWWNTHLIDLCFYPPEAKLIKSLPLCSTLQLDTLIWPKENSGNYSIKTGYKFLCETPDTDSKEAMARWQC
nr:hypothetical protein CFP56_67884 [Quercus suber]